MDSAQMSLTPLISVILPVHNGMPYLRDTVESVLGQTHAEFELLTIDDGSTDATAEYLRSISDRRIRYIRLEKAGLVAALNRGIDAASGPFIARIDADDIALPQRLAMQLAYMQSNPSCALLGCHFDEIDPVGRVIGENEYRMTSDAALRWQLLFSMPFLHPGVMYRADAARSVGGYRALYDVAEDYDMWVRLAAIGGVAALPELLMRKRMHPAAVSIVHRCRGMTQSSEIAATYACAVSDQFAPAAISELYWFYNGHPPKDLSLGRLVKTFNQTCEVFAELACLDSELRIAMANARRKLRWRCSDLMREHRYSPRHVFSYISAMRQFDPHEGRLGRLLASRLSTVVRKLRRLGHRN